MMKTLSPELRSPKMTLIEHAQIILEFLSERRDSYGVIAPLTNTELLHATGKNPSEYAVVYGQANALLDIASLEAGLPLFGHLVTFDRGDQWHGPWQNWRPYKTLVMCAPRLTLWTNEDIDKIRKSLQSGSPERLWRDMAANSDEWLKKAVASAQVALQDFIDQSPIVSAAEAG